MTEETPALEMSENKLYAMEVEYSYQLDKDAEVETSWYYHWVVSDNLKKATTAAKKHFTEMVKSTGWTSKVKIISIHEMKNDKSKPDVTVVSSTELPPARAKNAGTTRKSPNAKTTKTSSKPRAPRKPRSTKPKPNSLPL